MFNKAKSWFFWFLGLATAILITHIIGLYTAKWVGYLFLVAVSDHLISKMPVHYYWRYSLWIMHFLYIAEMVITPVIGKTPMQCSPWFDGGFICMSSYIYAGIFLTFTLPLIAQMIQNFTKISFWKIVIIVGIVVWTICWIFDISGLVLYWLVTVRIVGIYMMIRNDPEETLSWLGDLFALAIFGYGIYLVYVV